MASSSDSSAPTLLWLRRDLRLGDHPGWHAAIAFGGPVIPVFLLDPLVEAGGGAAPKWRLGESLAALARDLEGQGSRLLLRRGPAEEVLGDLIEETGARQVVWSRLYDLRSAERDERVEKALRGLGVTVKTVNASLLFEPWTCTNRSGGFYKVYSPFWRAVRGREVDEPLSRPAKLAPPERWPRSESLSEWHLGRAMNRGGEIVARHARVGEGAAGDRLGAFVDDRIARYKADRDFPARHATSGLSENLTYGEISPRTASHAARQALEDGAGQAEHFLKELVWREFAYHLLHHSPQIETGNWREEWDAFPWRDDNGDAERWRRGMTGFEMVDAAMREMYVTGTMHNRTRMLTASFLTKHLMTHWRVGEAWFRECLIDWDVASNALGWQWTAGSGPDAAPYFRIYNPELQAAKFDPERRYRDRFIAEGRRRQHRDAIDFFLAVPRSWNMSPKQVYPSPVVDLAEGRARALAAYESRSAA